MRWSWKRWKRRKGPRQVRRNYCPFLEALEDRTALESAERHNNPSAPVRQLPNAPGRSFVGSRLTEAETAHGLSAVAITILCPPIPGSRKWAFQGIQF